MSHHLCQINQYFKSDPIKVTGIMGIVASRSRLRLYTLMISFGHGFQLKNLQKKSSKKIFKKIRSKIFVQKFLLKNSKKFSLKNLKKYQKKIEIQKRLFTMIDIFVTISMIDIEFERLTHAETNQNLYWNRLADQLNYT